MLEDLGVSEYIADCLYYNRTILGLITSVAWYGANHASDGYGLGIMLTHEYWGLGAGVSSQLASRGAFLHAVMHGYRSGPRWLVDALTSANAAEIDPEERWWAQVMRDFRRDIARGGQLDIIETWTMEQQHRFYSGVYAVAAGARGNFHNNTWVSTTVSRVVVQDTLAELQCPNCGLPPPPWACHHTSEVLMRMPASTHSQCQGTRYFPCRASSPA